MTGTLCAGWNRFNVSANVSNYMLQVSTKLDHEAHAFLKVTTIAVLWPA